MPEFQPVGDEYRMPFGKFKGRAIKTVPAYYLDWLSKQEWMQEWPRILAWIGVNREIIDEELRERKRGGKR